MKKVLNNHEVYHIFAQQNQNEGYNTSRNMSFYGKKALSYNQCIGKIIGNHIFIINWNYSITTSQHISSLKIATSHYIQIFVREPNFYDSANNIEDFEQTLKDLAEKSVRSNKHSESYLDRILELKENIRHYKDVCLNNNLPLSETEVQILDSLINFEVNTDLIKKKIKEQKAENKIKKDKEEKEFFTKLDLWKKFDPEVNFYNRFNNLSYLRVKDGIIETSENIKIELSKVIPFVKLYKKFLEGNFNLKEKITYKHLDYYIINEVNENFVRIGCHTISKDEIISLL